MNKNIKISGAIVALLLLAILAVNIVAASTAIPKSENTIDNISAQITEKDLASSNTNQIDNTNLQPSPLKVNTDASTLAEIENMEQIKAKITKTYEESEASIVPTRNRFLLYTSDGTHIMWGFCGNGRFVGTDNNGIRCWGIYGQGIFAGFYDGEFFWGKYSNTQWKAEYLFGLRYSHGNYVLFPTPIPTTANTP